MQYYKEHDQWKLITPVIFKNTERSQSSLFNYSDKVLHIKMRRDPKFYNYVFIAPAIMVHLLAPLVFLLPVESGEKISLSITLLLAQILTMAVIAELLPPSSAHFPKCGYFSAFSIFQMAVQTLATVLGTMIHFYGFLKIFVEIAKGFR